jgi:hypothetical protein
MSCLCDRQGFRVCCWALRVRCECGCFTGVCKWFARNMLSWSWRSIKLLLVHLVGFHIYFTYIDDARSNTNQVHWLLALSCLSFLSACPSAWDNSVPTGWIFMKFDIREFSENLPRKIKFHSNMTRIAGTLREDLCTLRIISRWILLGTINVSDNICRENRNTYIIFSNLFYENRGRDIQAKHDNTIQRMRFVCWIPKATDTNAAYVTLTICARQ